MKKISTLYKKNPDNLALVINEIDPQNHWVIDGEGVATQKFDCTAATIIDGKLYKRYDVKKGRSVPKYAIPCQEPDAITGHWPHWVLVSADNPEDKYFIEALARQALLEDGTYELCGPKVQGNPEGLVEHTLIKHGDQKLWYLNNHPLTFNLIKDYLDFNNIEGIVFHHPDGRMCKIRKSDFGIKRKQP